MCPPTSLVLLSYGSDRLIEIISKTPIHFDVKKRNYLFILPLLSHVLLSFMTMLKFVDLKHLSSWIYLTVLMG